MISQVINFEGKIDIVGGAKKSAMKKEPAISNMGSKLVSGAVTPNK